MHCNLNTTIAVSRPGSPSAQTPQPHSQAQLRSYANCAAQRHSIANKQQRKQKQYLGCLQVLWMDGTTHTFDGRHTQMASRKFGSVGRVRCMRLTPVLHNVLHKPTGQVGWNSNRQSRRVISSNTPPPLAKALFLRTNLD